MEWEKEACDECKKYCLLFHGKRVSSFFKVMLEERCLQVLFFPPKFARSVPHLTDQETYLEDSGGQRWRVTVCNHNGSLAIQQGWPKFSSEHGLNMGDFLVFHYVSGQHFIVQIFGTSGCEKIKLCTDISKGEKRARTYPEATTPVELLQTTDINSVKKKSKRSAVSESEKVTDKPNITVFATNIDANNGKGQLADSTIYVDESFCMIDRDAQYDQGDRLCLHLLSFEAPASKPLAEGTSSLLKGDNGNTNHVETNLRSQTEPNLDVDIDKLNSEAFLPTFEAGITGTDMVSRLAEDIPLQGSKDEKSKEASQFAREARLVKKEYEETTAEAFCPVRAITDSGEEHANGNEKVIKSEPADSGETTSLNAVSYSCLLEVDGRDFLELPESWQNHLMKREKLGRRIIFLRGPDKRIWPTFYHSRSGCNVLTCGWKNFTAAYGLNPGDGCLFKLVNQRERIFDVRKICKSKSKMPKELVGAD